MQLAIEITAKCLYIIFSLLQLTMFVSAILSWIESARDTAFYRILHEKIVDPLTAPVRAILQRFEIFRSSPLDFSFLITFVIIMVLTNVVAIFM